MKTSSDRLSQATDRSWFGGLKSVGVAAFALASLTLLSSALPLVGSSDGDKGHLRASSEDGIGTLPMSFAPMNGLVLTGTAADLVATIGNTTQQPTAILRLSGNEWAVLFTAGSIVDLDRGQLGTGSVRAFYTTSFDFEGGSGTLSSGANVLASFELSQGFIELPLGVAYGRNGSMTSYAIDAATENGSLHRMVLAPQADVLRIGQISVDGSTSGQ